MRVWLGFALLLGVACGTNVSGYPIASGYCNACAGKPYTAEECDQLGKASECLSAVLDEPSVEGCANSCVFESCKKDLTCGGGSSGPGGPPGPGPVPSCGDLAVGVYASVPSCDGATEITFDGVVAYVCACEAGCPCDFGCGLIPGVDDSDRWCAPRR
ncbi:hypothetical protein BH09MYX1_BH09MYX1_01180 [soil metagenome]